MAAGPVGSQTLRSTGSAPGAAAARREGPAERERYIERQLRKTRRQVRGVELAGRLMLLAAAAVAFFLVAAVVDHWIVPGGLSIYGRLAFLAAFLIGAGWFAARELAPLFVYRINPLFAAQTIERSKPTLKNTLINFLMLRSSRAAVPEVVLTAVEEQAAANLQHTPIEHVVDRTRVIHIGYVLLAMVSAFCLYYLVSPKSPLATLGRVVLPWADLVPPSRVELDEIQPGTTTVFRGERVNISAMVSGLADDEAVTLYFTTTDRQSVDQPVRMYVASGSNGRHTATLPPATAQSPSSLAGDGLQQDVEYRIEAGDAVSRTYRLSVIQAPNIVVDKLDYDYPEYTRLERETVERTGDIKAVEGTAVTIHAAANQPIASAYVDLGGDGKHKQPMKVDGQRATTTLRLALNEGRTSPLFSHYLVRFVNDRGYDNPEPIRYRIEVTPDPAPEVQILRPEKVEMAVPLGSPLPFEIEASDALYGLADVRIVANVGGEAAFRRNRTIGPEDKSAARLVFKYSERLDRITLAEGTKLKPGDVIEYWAEAVDNKTPKPNVTKSNVRKLIIAEPQKDDGANQQPQDRGQDQGDESPNEKQANDRGQDAKNDAEDRGEQKNRDQQGTPSEKGGQRRPNDDQKQRGDSQDDRRGAKEQPNKANPNQNNAQNNQPQKGGDGDRQQDQRPMNGTDQQGNDRNDQKSAAGEQRPKNQERTGNQEKNGKQDSRGADGSEAGDQGAANNSQPDQKDGNGSPQANEEPPVDQSDEGEAFNRILEHAKEKDGKSPEQSDSGDSSERPSGDQNTDEAPKPANGKKGQDNQSQAADQRRDATGGKTEAANEKSDNGGNKGADKQKADEHEASQDKGATEGAAPKPAAQNEGAKNNKSGEAQSDQQKNDKQGSGESGGDTPAPQEKARPKDGQQPAGDAGKNNQKRSEKSPAHGSKESDTQGENSGDRTGKGKEGGGQNDNRAGKGASGASDAADEGGKAADEQGRGDTGAKAGTEKRADGKTGQSGAEKGDGSKSQPTAGEQQNGKQKAGAADAKSQTAKRDEPIAKTKGQQPKTGANEPEGTGKSAEDSSQNNGQKGDQAGTGDKQNATPETPDGNAAPNGGGGRPSGDAPPPPDAPRAEPTDDKANLEYAKRATDLALDHLRQQLKDGQPDQDLLDRLGWSKEDLQKMLTRWEKMRREAQQPGPQATTAKRNFQEALRSLGLRRNTARGASSPAADDAARGLRDAARSAPPPEYADDYRAFQRSTSRAEK